MQKKRCCYRTTKTKLFFINIQHETFARRRARFKRNNLLVSILLSKWLDFILISFAFFFFSPSSFARVSLHKHTNRVLLIINHYSCHIYLLLDGLFSNEVHNASTQNLFNFNQYSYLFASFIFLFKCMRCDNNSKCLDI